MGRVGSVVDAARSPSEALRLLDESEAALDPSGPLTQWVREGNARFREQIRDGSVSGTLWIGPKDEAVALALWSEAPESGRNVVVALGDGFRSPETLVRFVQAIDTPAPVRSLGGPIAGLSDAAVGAALGPLGFTGVERMDMVFATATPVPVVAEVAGLPSCSIGREDQSKVGRLIERAYRDTLDRWLFARTLDDEFGAAAAAEVLGTGVWEMAAGGVLRHRGSRRSRGRDPRERARWGAPERGHGRPRLAAARPGAPAHRPVDRRGAGARPGSVRLVVTIGNDRAEPLYRSLGFEATPLRGSLWLRVPQAAAGAAEGSSR